MLNLLRVGGTYTKRDDMPVQVTDTSTGRGLRGLVLSPELSRVWSRATKGEFQTDKNVREMMDAAGFDIMDVLEFVFLPVIRASVGNWTEVGKILRQHGYGREEQERQNIRSAALTVGLTADETEHLVSALLGDRQACTAPAS